MVVARTKLMIQDELLRPRPIVTLTYNGPNPEKFYNEIYNLLFTVWKVSERTLQEKKFVWKKGDPEEFEVTWEVDKDLDKFSYYWIELSLRGESSKGYGKATITVHAALRTEYPQDTILQKSLLYEFLRVLWHNTFYISRRDEYVREGRILLSLFLEKLKELTRV